MTTIPKAVRDLVDQRAAGRCERCNAPLGEWWSRQHRIARGMGGTRRPWVNSAASLVVLCGSSSSPGCHRLCEDRDPAAIADGYVLSLHTTTDPALIPIRLHSGWALLGHDGGITYLEGVA